MNTYQKVIILSAELSTLGQRENSNRTILLDEMLSELNISYKNATGCYKGTSETSFVCVVNNDAELDTIKNFAFKNFNQESVLEQDSNGICRLEYQNDTSEVLGKLRQVSGEVATKQDAYTVMGGKYYVVA